jgi:hypothetical protein
MRFDHVGDVEEVVFAMRETDQTRAEDRAVLLRLYGGRPPFSEDDAAENGIQVNMNDLTGPNVLSQARAQWNGAHLKPSNFFSAKPDSGPGHKRSEWGSNFSTHANRLLKRDRRMVGLVRAQGANTMLFGIGPSNWKDRRTIIPNPIPVGSLLIPAETEIDDFDNLQHFAIFRQWTPTMLWDMTHGPKTDPGWNMPLVNAQLEYVRDELRKQANSLAYQYQSDRIEELLKESKGYMDSDAVPTCDVYDFYFRESEDGNNWYRRIILDWGTGNDISTYSQAGTRPESRNKVGDKSGFLYTSGNRKYADSASEIFHCQFGDCSAYAPFHYHSVRGLGWMLWGVCELQNRLHCKFSEAVFESMMWFFKIAGNQDLIRIKKATFEHMGVIPQGIAFVTPAERSTPNMPLLEMAFARNREQIGDMSNNFTKGYDQGKGEGRTATETMAIVNSSNALSASILDLSYTYQKFLYIEMVRRLCLKNSTDPMAREFRLACLNDGIPEDMLDVNKWSIEPEQVLGGGNKTLQMASVGFLNTIRKNLPPNGQRVVDHISVEAATDQPDLAEEIAPLGQDKPISNSTNMAQLATERIMRGLPFQAPKDAIFEDYVMVWMHDMGLTIQKIMQRGGTATPDELGGLMNLGKHIKDFLDIMAKPATGKGAAPEDKHKIKQLEDAFGQLMNHVKALAQRLQESMKKQAGANGNGAQGDPKAAAQVQGMMMQAQTKAKILADTAALKQRHKDQSFQSDQKRKDAQTAAEITRGGVRTRHELLANRLKALAE